MVYSFVLTNSVFLYSDVSIFRHVVILRVALRRVPPQNAQYSHYVKYLKKYTSDITLPFLIDVNVVYLKSELRFHITVSSVHMPNRTYQQTPESIIEGDSNYTLMFYGRTYCNAMNYGQTPIKDIHQLLFVVPTEVVWRDGGVISISLIKAIPRRVYNSIKAYVRVPPSKRLPVVSYSYISDYNTISELKSFVAYQKLINISKVFFYAATPIPHFEEVFRNLMQQGYVVLIDYTWPRPNKALIIQDNTQIGGVNSAFYRLKYEADAIIICDVDEYLNSETQPLNVDIVVDTLFTQYPDLDVFRMRSNMYTNEKNDLSNREEYLQNGTVLSAYVYRLPIQNLGREKLIVRNSFNSILGNHMCFHCKQDYVALNIARIAHYRSRVPMGEFEYSDTLSNRTELLQQALHRYFV